MPRKECGFTLPEVLIATLVLLIALIPLLGLFEKGSRSSVAGWEQVTAVSLAQGEMEKLKRMPYRNLTSVSIEAFESPFEDYTRKVDVDLVGEHLVQITITVSHQTMDLNEVCVLQAWRSRR
ncbi:MAG: prepilin-type N-terminal cleavage/methylation domain-containing protein [Eubacteriales bacterium]|nr:prepilin-type N-terminal cleavage/methylation domain-containing protein [Bacillota bacterium]MBV1727246.1 prepilin-type N-terminal cleavage/methylation domain-containing protein [Desulforudis sp.]MDP3049926.1 prepilin-type N-terminal cleavage/methylation domain-containing protein [Eubacteriales bacterium]MDQ7788488.1 prepilin-type N-terminal cleavage/methylation domain-containing protein [Clostridia bacterium]MBU4532119.1 prepilin-type N-terminal cleavage/methylation domain-containing protei